MTAATETTTRDDGNRNSEDDPRGKAEATDTAVSSPPPTSSPPYWLVQHTNNAPGASGESTTEPGGITMRDNETEDCGGRNSACWARSVEIPDYVVVNGSSTNIGAFVVFNVRVETMNVSDGLPESRPGMRAVVLPSHEQPLTWDVCAGRLHEHSKALLRV